ncbi:hypothetical protein [Nesterenkonia alba]|uniref:hypothetical protein n=1 Tax=Nesterenkonia alba TaxID=515814 RepID=UPI00040F6D51|nr:hypothetical protein [Nesterenkonia alba]
MRRPSTGRVLAGTICQRASAPLVEPHDRTESHQMAALEGQGSCGAHDEDATIRIAGDSA